MGWRLKNIKYNKTINKLSSISGVHFFIILINLILNHNQHLTVRLWCLNQVNVTVSVGIIRPNFPPSVSSHSMAIWHRSFFTQILFRPKRDISHGVNKNKVSIKKNFSLNRPTDMVPNDNISNK